MPTEAKRFEIKLGFVNDVSSARISNVTTRISVFRRFASKTTTSTALQYHCTCCQSPSCTFQQSSVRLFPAHCEFRHDYRRRCCFPRDFQLHSLLPVTAVLSRYDIYLGGGQELSAICTHPPAGLKWDHNEVIMLNESTHILTAAPARPSTYVGSLLSPRPPSRSMSYRDNTADSKFLRLAIPISTSPAIEREAKR